MDSYRPVISFIILISVHVGHTLRCACKEDLRTCISIHNMQADFKTAQKICMENGGKLLTPSSKIIDSLLFNTTGHFWIGAEGKCLSSSRNSQRDSETLNRGGEDVACSSQCMWVSSNRKFERPCEEQADGFLCDGIQWENCWEDTPSEVQILNKKDCSLAPCEHRCKNVPGGHMCSCLPRFRPSRKHPERCEYYCNSATCPQLCPTCECPEGFIKDEKQCTDLDECKSNHHNCAQKCRNTFGRYKCSCHEGFMLVNKSKCVPLIKPTPLTAMLGTPSVNYTLSHAAFATPAEYIGLTLFIILAISALIGLLYYLRKSKSDVLLKNSDAPDDTTVQEAQLHL
ncbi:signal peptide, CUB and EGF-like domain-containing protein 2 [Pangasianodon hypophthalmus]|uniref:signal peptide, CUB and EGF-like domain-containing protein 2 n=1 Tax=Pangasianodon hypophthalmus TaxID=310915 RepID=UPI002306E7CC|nr:signal peptide, CUB and EGF-like domain-containing protein 2 [Pangasianodon hypophthalmus]